MRRNTLQSLEAARAGAGGGVGGAVVLSEWRCREGPQPWPGGHQDSFLRAVLAHKDAPCFGVGWHPTVRTYHYWLPIHLMRKQLIHLTCPREATSNEVSVNVGVQVFM